jgi:hypothetical protein
MIQFFTVLLVLTQLVYSQDNQINLSYPASVSWNTPFEVSIISPVQNSVNGQVYIIIESPDNIKLNKVTLNTLFGSSQLELLEQNASYVVEFNPSEKNLSSDMHYQLLFSFKPENINKTKISFSGILKTEQGDHALFGNNNLTANIDFYKPKKYAGKALQLNGGSLNFKVNSEKEPLAVDFWFKTPVNDLTILKILNRNEVLFDIFTNSFGMISLQSHYINKNLRPAFISRNTWNHIALFIRDNEFEFYCNGLLVSANEVEPPLFSKEFEFSFEGVSGKEYYIDQINVCRIKDDEIFRILGNRNFTSPPSGVEVISSFRMDGDAILKEGKELTAAYKNLKYIKSDAPIGLKSPDLNISVYSATLELEWSGGDYKHASEYVLEKSESNNQFLPVYTVSADGESDSKYTYTERTSDNSDVVYYRVRQILKDGSSVFSSQVKVGQGYSEPFMLAPNFPNPFNPKTSIDIEIFRDSDVEVLVFNLEGKEVARLFDGNLSKGKHKFSFDASELPSGVYICRVQAQEYTQSSKMVLTK